jgi:hypothetical protein
MYKRNIDLGLFPESDKADFSAFEPDEDFVKYATDAGYARYTKLDSELPVLRLWHIRGAESRVSPKQLLYTFYELSSPTPNEVGIVKSQHHTFFSSSESAEAFKKEGCDNVSYVPVGFDPDFKVLDREYFPEDVIHWILVGKFERRKNTQAIIQCWLNRFGNNRKHQLTCLINNPFIPKDQYAKIMQQTLGGQHYSNINFLPHLKTNAEVNDLINSADIDLSGFSNAEGWNLGSFNATALGKWSIVTNCSAHKDWANEENSILVEPIGTQPCYDNFFFREGTGFNQGDYASFTAESLNEAFDRALIKAKSVNVAGLKLQEEFSYSKMLDSILEKA